MTSAWRSALPSRTRTIEPKLDSKFMFCSSEAFPIRKDRERLFFSECSLLLPCQGGSRRMRKSVREQCANRGQRTGDDGVFAMPL